MRNDFKVGDIWKYNFSSGIVLRFEILSGDAHVVVKWIDGDKNFEKGQVSEYDIWDDIFCEIDETSMAKRILETYNSSYESKPGGHI
jgi:hypothetical protein